ncbi:MAG: (5-formylfuran-3-yl)methyl phosphate synthase [Paludibacterium sp.]|uniref:(5-formylfuran-3-yl)methyl phosphate synthase n=1 Tax=Paludibacterium sp. TaxID=1917523 RepID=UPI0025F6F57C|nr:(5-formylfuran-3-yl)methyl phosphate synthase [Paludibacterium sp.]MBV8049075.1 (5-formylfuran-3-yl)methyl phosphate synthase [Paludibacterium sp.]MBV8649415.1 (5-formylfuran-3-yl)methyl phosphate synthase [Paludibacterium sp.]
MKVLISPISTAEAVVAWQCGTNIIDIKNIHEGSLGASFPWIIREVIGRINDPKVVFSATLGDLPHKPGTASLAALGAVSCGVKYVKAGLHGSQNVAEGVELMRSVVRTCKDHDPNVTVVTAGYADYRRFGGLSPKQLVEIAATAKSDMVMVDTYIKDGKTLFDSLSEDQLAEFVRLAHDHGLKVALAGSVRAEHLPVLARVGADVVGVRGAVCGGYDRGTSIDPGKAEQFIKAANAIAVAA